MRIAHSLASRLSLKILFAVISLFFLFYAANSYFSMILLREEVESSAKKSLTTVVTGIDNILGGVESAANSQIWHIKEHIDDPEYMYHLTREYVANDPLIVGSTVAYIKNYFNDSLYFAPYSTVASDGSVFSFQMGNENYNYFEMDWFKSPYTYGKSMWSEPYFDEGGGNMIMTTYSVPIRDSLGKIVAIFTSDVTLADITAEVSSHMQYDKSYAIILDRDGSYVSHRDSAKLLIQSIFDTAADYDSDALADLGGKMLNGEAGIVEALKIDNEKSFIVYGPVSNGWSAGIVCEYDNVFANLNTLFGYSLFFIVIGLILIYLISRKIIQRFMQPITELAYTALNIAKGNFNANIPEVKTNDELFRMSKSLSYMLSSVKIYMRELKQTTASNERYESELNVANSIQMDMLSKNFPSHGLVDLFATLKPAKEVGGDLYDFIIKNDKNLYFCIGDVSGKGVPAALYMAITRSAFRFIAGMELPVNIITSKLNDAFCEGNDLGMFVTLFIGKINLDTYEMEYCNAGHNPIIIVGSEGETRYLRAKPNLAAGLYSGFEYEMEKLTLQKGSRLVLYTDGITEAEDSVQHQYGETRLLEFAKQESVTNISSEHFVEKLISSVKSFTGDYPQYDDITVMSIKL